MALQSSGQISLKNIADEFNDSAPHKLSEFRGKGSIPASGQAKISQMYGASNAVFFSATGGSVQTIGLLVEAIKELTAKVEELENK